MSTTYETDFYTWTQEQAALLRAGRLAELDTINLIEEIEDMGRGERRELENRLSVLLAHLLKWQYQPERRGKSWLATIGEQRLRSRRVLRRNPGLQAALPESFIDAYEDARFIAMRETGLDGVVFPLSCPWTFEQVLDNGFWPEQTDNG